MAKGQAATDPVREHYSFSLSLRLSKNYNSMEARVEYGRDARPGESRDELMADVEATVEAQLETATNLIDTTLGGLK